jgi:hypothetical protein
MPVWVEWWPENEPHGHNLLLDDGALENRFIFNGEALEDAAGELAEAVAICNEGRHSGHGKTHSSQDMEDAYHTAIYQLLTIDFQAEWKEIQDDIRKWQKWQGPVPAAVLMPDIHDSKQWNVMIPDKNGDPVMYQARPNALTGLMPSPEEMGARPNKLGVGWTTKPRRKK